MFYVHSVSRNHVLIDLTAFRLLFLMMLLLLTYASRALETLKKMR